VLCTPCVSLTFWNLMLFESHSDRETKTHWNRFETAPKTPGNMSGTKKSQRNSKSYWISFPNFEHSQMIVTCTFPYRLCYVNERKNIKISTAPRKLGRPVVFVALGRVVRKPFNVNPGLKVHRVSNFSSIKTLSTAYVLCSLRLIMLKTEGRKK